VEEDDVDAGSGDAGAVAVAGEWRFLDLPAAALLTLEKPVQLQVVLQHEKFSPRRTTKYAASEPDLRR